MKEIFVLIAATIVGVLCPLLLEAQDVFVEGTPAFHGEKINLPSFASLAEVLGPGVVNITVEADPSEPQGDLSIPGLPFQFKRENRPIASLGSGFVISDDGYVVTNNHVIEKAGKVVVRLLDDKTEYVAEIIGRDPKTDLALLKIDPGRKLPALKLGDSEAIKTGDWVLAIGHQFQLGQTVTLGIVSAKARKVPQGGPYDNFIQTDASINPGSSGGPLFNVSGSVIGINTAIFSPGRSQFGGTGFNIGIGFATPINIAKTVIRQLRESGKVTRGWLGVLIQQITPDVAYALGLDSFNGALVGHVMKGSPADKGGFKSGDVIISYSGQAVNENDDLPLMVANTTIGTTVAVEIVRDGKAATLTAYIEVLKEESSEPKGEEPKSDDFGLALENVTDAIAKSLKLSPKEGAHVRSVKPGSVAELSGLQTGDVIAGVVIRGKGLQTVTNVTEFYQSIKPAEKGKPLLLFVRRKDPVQPQSGIASLYLTLKPE